MRFVPEDGIAVGELARRSHLSAKSLQMVVKRMSKWWGYLLVGPDPADTRTKPPHAAWLVRPTDYGRQAQRVWEPLTLAIENRWQARFGDQRIEQLRTSLWNVVKQFDVELPDYLPVGEARLGPLAKSPEELAASEKALPTLLSKMLLTFALEFERESDLSLGIYTSGGAFRLAISANILRVLDKQGVRVADIPELTGVAKMATDNWLRSLEEHQYLDVGPDSGSRSKIARLTPKGLRARDIYLRWADTVELRWQERFGSQALRALRASSSGVAQRSGAQSLLWSGMQPYPDGWRAKIRAPKVLPHYPTVSPRGGFPDGS
jgi:DNA-binding MarR family transcriptional regulator